MNKILLIGYGNPLRSDDGAGPRTAELIEKRRWPGVSVRVLHQLDVSMAEELRDYKTVIMVDVVDEVPAGGPDVALRKVEPATEGNPASTHHLSPEFLLSLCQRLYGFTPDLRLCTIRGEKFDLGAELTPAVQRRVDEAEKKIMDFIGALNA